MLYYYDRLWFKSQPGTWHMADSFLPWRRVKWLLSSGQKSSSSQHTGTPCPLSDTPIALTRLAPAPFSNYCVITAMSTKEPGLLFDSITIFLFYFFFTTCKSLVLTFSTFVPSCCAYVLNAFSNWVKKQGVDCKSRCRDKGTFRQVGTLIPIPSRSNEHMERTHQQTRVRLLMQTF